MSGRLQITISGGQVAVGSVAQGDHARVEAVVEQSVRDLAFGTARERLASVAREQDRPAGELEAVRRSLDELGAEAQRAEPSLEKGSAILEAVRREFSWAYPLLKDAVAVAWPALLAALAP